jgi:hypothetical protein
LASRRERRERRERRHRGKGKYYGAETARERQSRADNNRGEKG